LAKGTRGTIAGKKAGKRKGKGKAPAIITGGVKNTPPEIELKTWRQPCRPRHRQESRQAREEGGLESRRSASTRPAQRQRPIANKEMHAMESFQDRSAIDAESSGDRPAFDGGSLSNPKSLAERANRPLAGLDLRTKKGRLIRDLYRNRMAAFDDETAGDLTVQLAVRRVVELQVIGDGLRSEMLAAPAYDKALGEELVRVENLVRRAEAELAELIADVTKEESWYERAQRDRQI
jgi:hypothetical protein